MADNSVLNAGSGGDTYSSDDIGGSVKVQNVKVSWGAHGTKTYVDTPTPMPVTNLGGGSIALQASQVSGVANATTTRTTTTGLDIYGDLSILINITSAGVATGTLQLFLEDSLDGGTTWDDLVSSPAYTFGAALATYLFTLTGRLATSRAQAAAAQQETLAAGTIRQGPFGERIRVREKVSGVSGSPTGVTYVISAVGKR